MSQRIERLIFIALIVVSSAYSYQFGIYIGMLNTERNVGIALYHAVDALGGKIAHNGAKSSMPVLPPELKWKEKKTK